MSRTLGSLTAADLGKTITVGDESILLDAIDHGDVHGMTWAWGGRYTEAIKGDYDTPCEVTP